jgi:hypothetical protein
MIDLHKENLLEDGEYVTDAVRKHWIVYARDFILHAFGCLIFIVAAYYLALHGSFGGVSGGESAYGAMVLIMFALIFWTSFFYAWTKEYFDVWYITTVHIIAINQKEMFTRDEAFMELVRIQDVFFEKEGLLSNLLGFGRLRVQSAGTEQEFVIENVHDVETVAHAIMEIRDKVQGKKTASETSV